MYLKDAEDKYLYVLSIALDTIRIAKISERRKKKYLLLFRSCIFVAKKVNPRFLCRHKIFYSRNFQPSLVDPPCDPCQVLYSFYCHFACENLDLIKYWVHALFMCGLVDYLSSIK